MNVSAAFIVRPIATTLLVIAVVLVGLLGYRMLPIAALPTVEFPSIQVVTGYPGASPDVVQSSISAPLEFQLGRIPGLEVMTSSSSYGTSQITLQFSLSRDIASAAQDVQAAIAASAGWLPLDQLPTPPTYHQINPADTPVVALALTSDTMPLHSITEYAATAIVPRLSQVEGVGEVTVEGGQARAVRLQINPRKLSALGLSLEDVRRAIQDNSVDLPKGQIDGARQSFQIGNNDQLFNAEAYRDVIIAYRHDAPVMIKDVGDVVEGLENEKLAGWYNGKPAVILQVKRQPGANIIKLADSIAALLPEIGRSSPGALTVTVASDRTTTIRAAVAEVQRTLVITVALVILVIFLFLRKFWATLIPSVTLPVSLIATFAVMAAIGFSLDNLSLMALSVASGFIVDDAIVMIENIVRFIEKGERPIDAALKGSRQIAFTIVSLTVSLIAVFIPLLLMGGVVGRLFREFAITLSAAIVISGLVSLILTPMMCAKLLKPHDPRPPGRLFRLSERGFDAMLYVYEGGLRWALRHQTTMLLFTAVTIVLSVWLFLVIPKGFVPVQDTGLVAGVTDAAQDISFERMSALQQKVADIVAKDSDVVSVISLVGVGTQNTTANSGRLYIDIGSPDRRHASATAIMDRLRKAVSEVTDIRLHLQPVQDLQVETRPTRTQYQYVLQDLDEPELRAWAAKLLEALRKQPDLADVVSDQQELGQQMMITVNREMAARFGLNIAAIDQVLYDAFGQRQVGTIYSSTYLYHVVLEVSPEYRNAGNALDSIYATRAGAAAAGVANQPPGGVSSDFNHRGGSVPLAAFAEMRKQLAPLLVTHQNQFPAITLSFNMPTGGSLGQALETLRNTQRAIGLPQTIETNPVGTAAEFSNSLKSQPILIAAAIIAVYVVLGILYESYIHPITILSTLPSAGVGALLALMMFGMDLDLISLIGIILLIGIVKKNGIMMVDFALVAERQEGLRPEQSIYQACLLRFRPIMMTTMAALLGALPLAMGVGTGSELRRPLGIAIVGGLLVSQFLTLYTTPVIYLMFARLERRFRRKPRLSYAEPVRGVLDAPPPAVGRQAARGCRGVNWTEPFIRRPVATALLTLSIGLLGILALFYLPIASLPNIERPTINVFAGLPGGSAETVASSLTAPLERQLGLISGLKEMHASSIYGRSIITLEFGLDTDINAAAGAVQAAINAASTDLPKDLPGPPIYVKANPNGFPIIALALTSDVIDAPDVYQYADTVLAGKLSQIQGVAKVVLNGAARPGVRIQVNPRALANMGLSMSSVKEAVLNASTSLPKGEISDGPHAVTLAANDQLSKAADYRDVILAWRNDTAVKLPDVADIFDSTLNDDAAGWYDNESAVVLYILKDADANVVHTVDATLAMLPQLERWIPAGIKVHVLYDRTQLIRAAIADVKVTIGVTILLVVLVLLLFLRRFWITIIPSVTIPVSLAATMGVIYLLGFSLDNISLLALTIAVGFVVDDSVIIIENITRRVRSGEHPIEAALKGTRQMGFTVISVAAALIATLIPVLFMPDIAGRLFREFGLTLMAAIITSAIVSLTLTPMMCGQLLDRGEVKDGRLDAFFERILDRCVGAYARSLDWALRHGWLPLLFGAALTTASVALYVGIPKGFLPTQDTGVMNVRTLSRSNISFDAKAKSQADIAAAILADPAVDHLASYVGRGTMSVGAMLVSLKPLDVRQEPIDRVIDRLTSRVSSTENAKTVFTPQQDLNVGAKKSASRYQYTLSGFDPAEVARWALLMKSRIEKLPQVADVHINYENKGLGLNLVMNRVRAARAGTTPADIDNVLYEWFGQTRLNLIRFPIGHARVVLEVAPAYRDAPSDLDGVFLNSALPADILSTQRRERAAMWLPHDNGIPALTVTFNTAIGGSISEAMAAIRDAEAEAQLPSYITTGFRGEARLAEETAQALPWLFLAAIVTVYIILGMLYESFAHPFTILSTLPSAAFGALLALVLTRTQFTIISAIACILVVGIVMKNAIMMIDFALDAERESKISARQAIRQAAQMRFRPIVMTTLAALLGAVPLALDTGPGSELRQPLGIAIVGGLLLSQFVTLYTTPAIYLAIDRLRSKRSRLVLAHS